jgi:hypothetical protein
METHLVLFVHGLGGSAESTWGQFDRLLRDDADLGGIDIAYFQYPTFIFRLPFGPRYPGVQTLAKALATQVRLRHSEVDVITLVCHSLGGLIGKQYLIDALSSNSDCKVNDVVFYAVPNHGAGLAAVASFISWRHPQLRQLCKASDLIRSLAEGWDRVKAESRINVRYIVAAQDKVVDEHSALEAWANSKVDILSDRGHRDIVKPRGADDLAYLALKRHIRDGKRMRAEQNQGSGSGNIAAEGSGDGGDASNDSNEMRVSFSAILKIERDGRYLLIRNLHRPETFAPLGGVYKYFKPAKSELDKFSFRGQVIDADMRSDLRGFIAESALKSFQDWFASGANRESGNECMRRELEEELAEVGLSPSLVSPELRFRAVRSTTEGPEFVRSMGLKQFRTFDVYELIEDSPGAASLVEALVDRARQSADLLWVSAEDARRGRAETRQLVAAHVPYLFGTKRYREGDPIFVAR